MKTTKPPSAFGAPTDKELQALLQRHHCPMPLHAVRTLMLGAIASPQMAVSPMTTLAQAWGGELPVFATSEEVDEVLQVLLRGYWNRLADHQNVRNPFRLPRFEVAPTRYALRDLASMRAEEIEAFVDGLLGPQDAMLLPQKAQQAVASLAELHAMLQGAISLLADESKPAPEVELKSLLRNLQQMTTIADELINKTVQSCKRARIQGSERMATVETRKFRDAAADPNHDVEDLDSPEGDEPDFIESPLSQRVTRNGVAVKVDIYGDSDGGWILEVIDAENASHVWETSFETDQLALAAALQALENEPLEFFGRPADQSLN